VPSAEEIKELRTTRTIHFRIYDVQKLASVGAWSVIRSIGSTLSLEARIDRLKLIEALRFLNLCGCMVRSSQKSGTSAAKVPRKLVKKI
jgi:hypothetical protein